MSYLPLLVRPGIVLVTVFGAALGGACSSAEPAPAAPAASVPYTTVFAEDFAGRASVEDWAFSDEKAWRWSDAGGETSLELLGESEYEPPHRSPTSIALVPNTLVGDFDLDVDLQQTGRAYGHRDMCLFFGFQSPSRYYYVHLATAPDPNAHNVFLVYDAPRTNLAEVSAEGIDWGEEEWHHVRIERRVAEGTIRVFWDHGTEPILTAVDTTLDVGRIGFGSFDDSGRIANVVIRAPHAVVFSGPGDPFY